MTEMETMPAMKRENFKNVHSFLTSDEFNKRWLNVREYFLTIFFLSQKGSMKKKIFQMIRRGSMRSLETSV
jgi:hypothetical protein